MIEKIIAAILLFFSGGNPEALPSNNFNFEFKELTIPYLQQRKYESNLGDLNKYQENNEFVSYLTNYDSDNLKINGLLTIPKKERPQNGYPAIVFVHGYIPPTVYRTTEKYVDYVNYLARNGFVVFKIDLRGHGSSEGEAGGAYYSSDYIIDTLNAYSALENSGFVDKKKIYLWGHSMAGNVLLRSVAVKNDIPKVVIWGGAGFTYDDFLEYGIGDNSYRPPSSDSERARKRRLLMEYYGQYRGDSWFWKMVTPINYLDNVKTKIQLHHAVNDDVVNVEYSRNLKKILDEKKIDNEYYEYQLGGHNISNPSFTPAMQRTVEFLKE